MGDVPEETHPAPGKTGAESGRG